MYTLIVHYLFSFDNGYGSDDFAHDPALLGVVNAKLEDEFGTPDTWDLATVIGLECNLFYMAPSRLELINGTLVS